MIKGTNTVPPAAGAQDSLSVWEKAARRTEARRVFSRIGMALVVLLAARELAVWGIRALAQTFAPDLLSAWWFAWVLSFVPLYGIGLPCMLLSLRGVEKAPRNMVCRVRGREVPMPDFGLGWWILILIIALGCMEGGGLVGNGLMAALSRMTGYNYQNALNTVVEDSPLWMVALGTGILAPLGEEFIFRKLIIDRTRRYGDCVSILLSAAFFALFHLNLFQFFYAFLIGLLLAYLYTRTGRLRYSVALHAAANIWGGVVSTSIARWVDTDKLSSTDQSVFYEYLTAHPLAVACYIGYGLVAFSCLIAAFVLVIALHRRIRLGLGSVRLGGRTTAGAVFANVGVILALLLCLGFTVLSLIPPAVPAA